MITAKEARHKVTLQVECNEIMERIERSIIGAIGMNQMYTDVDCGEYLNEEKRDVVISELNRLGYRVQYEPAKPQPLGCPSDQWYSSDYLKIHWD